MHLFTITLHTKLFSQEYSDNQLEELSLIYFERFYNLLVKNNLHEHFEFELYWRRGCLIEDIIVKTQNKEWLRHFYKNEEPLKETEEYKKLLSVISKFMDDFPSEVAMEKAIFEIKNWYISTKDFESRGKLINDPLRRILSRNKGGKN